MSASPSNQRPRAGIVIPQQPTFSGRVAAVAAYSALRTLMATWRCEFEDRSGFADGFSTKPVIFALWHNRLALSMKVWTDHVRPNYGGAGLAALISASKDGGLLAKTLSYFGVQPVRGSSSRRGAQAMLELTSQIERGFHVAITPDGPRGPKYTVHEGAITLAQLTGCPIVPVSWSASSQWQTRSWDQFRIPRLFARVKIVLDAPLHVPREADREEFRQTLKERLLTLGD